MQKEEIWCASICENFWVYVHAWVDLALKCDSLPYNNIDITYHLGGVGDASWENVYFGPLKRPVWCDLGVNLHFGAWQKTPDLFQCNEQILGVAPQAPPCLRPWSLCTSKWIHKRQMNSEKIITRSGGTVYEGKHRIC